MIWRASANFFFWVPRRGRDGGGKISRQIIGVVLWARTKISLLSPQPAHLAPGSLPSGVVFGGVDPPPPAAPTEAPTRRSAPTEVRPTPLLPPKGFERALRPSGVGALSRDRVSWGSALCHRQSPRLTHSPFGHPSQKRADAKLTFLVHGLY